MLVLATRSAVSAIVFAIVLGGSGCHSTPSARIVAPATPFAIPEPPETTDVASSGTAAVPSQVSLAQIVGARTARSSSWQRNGGNRDFVNVAPGATEVLLDTEGPGMVTHIYFTLVEPDVLDFRDTILRMYWDGESTPSVEVPLGDFFCVSNCRIRHFSSALVSVNPGGDDKIGNSGYSCYFPMPFGTHARIELENQSDRYLGGGYAGLWYHVEYERYEQPLPPDLGRFHAQYRQETPTTADGDPFAQEPAFNQTGDGNSVMLEAEGKGHVVGTFLQIDNLAPGWYGEGDDMIFIDDDTWPPSLHGTGTEEVFAGGPTPDVEFAGLYTGFLMVENAHRKDFMGTNALYRWYVPDPIRFQKRVKMTIEHGHANQAANNYASVTYWYQQEPHAPFPALPGVAERRPNLPQSFWEAHDSAQRLYREFVPIRLDMLYGDKEFARHEYRAADYAGRFLNDGCGLMHIQDYDGARRMFDRAWEIWTSREQWAR